MSKSHSLVNTQNRLLASMLPRDRDLLCPDLVWVELPRSFVLSSPNLPVRYAYFLECGLGSVIGWHGEWGIEVGLFGRDGMSSTSLLLGSDRCPYECLMQIGGAGWRIEAGHLRAALQKSPSLTRLLLRYVQAHTVQVSETAMANGLLSMEQRLARWLLMCRLRTGVDDLPLTHEFLSIMLGVQRTGVTIALQSLERGAMIATRRGHVSVRDHLKLEAVAGDAYGVPEAEYRRLCGAF